jgi:hypothetical protein
MGFPLYGTTDDRTGHLLALVALYQSQHHTEQAVQLAWTYEEQPSVHRPRFFTLDMTDYVVRSPVEVLSAKAAALYYLQMWCEDASDPCCTSLVEASPRIHDCFARIALLPEYRVSKCPTCRLDYAVVWQINGAWMCFPCLTHGCFVGVNESRDPQAESILLNAAERVDYNFVWEARQLLHILPCSQQEVRLSHLLAHVTVLLAAGDKLGAYEVAYGHRRTPLRGSVTLQMTRRTPIRSIYHPEALSNIQQALTPFCRVWPQCQDEKRAVHNAMEAISLIDRAQIADCSSCGHPFVVTWPFPAWKCFPCIVHQYLQTARNRG